MPIVTAQDLFQARLFKSHVPDRPQWTWRQQVVTPTPEDVGFIPMSICKCPNNRSLSDPRFAPDQNHTTTPVTGFLEKRVETFENDIAF